VGEHKKEYIVPTSRNTQKEKSSGKSGSTAYLFHQQIPLEPLFLSLALYKTTSQQCSSDPTRPLDHFPVGKTECIFWRRIYPRVLNALKEPLFGLLLPIPSDAIQNVKRPPIIFFYSNWGRMLLIILEIKRSAPNAGSALGIILHWRKMILSPINRSQMTLMLGAKFISCSNTTIKESSSFQDPIVYILMEKLE